MSHNRNEIFESILSSINKVRNTDFSSDIVDPDFYLGGELGIDSREMLEVWYEIEKTLNITIHDFDKRDKYTLKDVVDTCERLMSAEAEACPA